MKHGRAPGVLSNAAWLESIEAQIATRVKTAQRTGSAEDLLPWQKVAETIAKERAVRPEPTIGKGMSRRALERYAARHFGGIENCRPMCRFAILQGLDSDGNPKWRGIDDAKANGINKACTTHETVFYISFEFLAQAPILIRTLNYFDS